MVNVRSIAEMGAYVNLLEYNNIEGMILLSELSRRRIRSINKLIRVGRHECVVVIRVDKDKGLLVFSFCKFHNQKQILHFFTLLLAVHAHWGRPPEIYKLYQIKKTLLTLSIVAILPFQNKPYCFRSDYDHPKNVGIRNINRKCKCCHGFWCMCIDVKSISH